VSDGVRRGGAGVRWTTAVVVVKWKWPDGLV
jgi:hypothetical protein